MQVVSSFKVDTPKTTQNKHNSNPNPQLMNQCLVHCMQTHAKLAIFFAHRFLFDLYNVFTCEELISQLLTFTI